MPGKITFLYSNIGRGHPFYLDGLLEALVRQGAIGVVKHQTDVFEVSHGLARRGWQLARWLYEEGSSGGFVGSLYSRVRRKTNYNRQSIGLRLLGRDIRRALGGGDSPLVVDHPTLVGILRGRANLIYQHGELVAPPESIVSGASVVCVPTQEVANIFRKSGYRDDQIFVSGLCIEPSLVRQAESAFSGRLTRLDGGAPLVGAFFSSGAEPQPHLAALCEACLAVVQDGGKTIVFAREGGRLHRLLTHTIATREIADHVVTSTEFLPQELPPILIALHQNRREETALTGRLFPHFDYFVAPSHERTNWALGLGLPMFVLLPTIGQFAKLNLQLVKDASVGLPMDSFLPSATIGVTLRHLRRESQLTRMAEHGWRQRDITGFANIAAFLVNRFSNE